MPLQTIETTITTLAAGQLCQNVMHFQLDITPTNLYQTARKFNDGLAGFSATGFTLSQYITLMSESAFISSIRAQVIKPSPGVAAIAVFQTTDFVGARSEGIYSQSVAALIRLFTPTGPDYTGRIFVPGIAEEDIINTRYTDDFISTVTTMIDTLIEGVESADGFWKPVVYRRATATSELVTRAQLGINPATIRRRLTPV